jgi:hypothetical protein
LAEIDTAFCSTPHRKRLFAGLVKATRSLANANCSKLYVNGSFTTEKDRPGDFDACWDPDGVNFNVIDPVLLDFRDRRQAQKSKFCGELFIASFSADGLRTYLDFFQIDKSIGLAKGILLISPTAEFLSPTI